MGTYRFTMKSEEQEGAAQNNSVYIDLANDSDAAIFADNLEKLCMADVVSVDAQIYANFTRAGGAYPAGTNNQWRMIIRQATPYTAVQTERVYNVLGAASAAAFGAAYKALAGVGWVDAGWVTTQPVLVPIGSVSITNFTPPDSV